MLPGKDYQGSHKGLKGTLFARFKPNQFTPKERESMISGSMWDVAGLSRNERKAKLKKAHKLWKGFRLAIKTGYRAGFAPITPPETWLTRRKAYMGKRYSGAPRGGFSGALGGGAVQKKKLLGV